MKNFIAILASLTITSPVLADPYIPEWKTPHSTGCMLLRECTEDTYRVTSVDSIKSVLDWPVYDIVAEEANGIIDELNKMGVEVYLAADKYFERGVAGSYHVVENKFFLNTSYVDDPYQLIETLRHEAWHAAQDAMAGTIDNTFLAVIENDKDIPQDVKLMAEIAYPPNAVPWEQEAKWAGQTKNMTLEVLKVINETNGRPWEVIDPTPLTRLWLERNGYL